MRRKGEFVIRDLKSEFGLEKMTYGHLWKMLNTELCYFIDCDQLLMLPCSSHTHACAPPTPSHTPVSLIILPAVCFILSGLGFLLAL